MGKMFEKIKNYKKSIHYYNLGNNLKRKNHEYSIDYDTKRFNAQKKTIDKFVTNSVKNPIGKTWIKHQKALIKNKKRH